MSLPKPENPGGLSYGATNLTAPTVLVPTRQNGNSRQAATAGEITSWSTTPTGQRIPSFRAATLCSGRRRKDLRGPTTWREITRQHESRRKVFLNKPMD